LYDIEGRTHGHNRSDRGYPLVFPNPEEVRLAPSRIAGVAGDGKEEKMVPAEAFGYMLAGVREVKMEMAAE
jgi:hypothetical protein